MARSEGEIVRAMMDQEITVPGEPAIPLKYPTTWNGAALAMGDIPAAVKGTTKMASTASDTSGFDIAGFMQEAAKQQGLVASTVSKLSEMSRDSLVAGDELVKSILGGTDSRGETPLSTQTKLLGELQLQNKKQELYSSIGMDGEGQSKISVRLAAQYNELMARAQEQTDAIVAKKQVGLFDNPLEYMINQVTLPDEINAMKATQAAAQMRATQLETVNKLAQDTVQTENLFKTTMTAASVDSQVQGVQANINAQAAQARITAINSNAHTLNQVLSAQGHQLQNIKSVIDMRNSQEYLGMAQEAHRQAKVRFDEWANDTEQKNASEAQMLAWYNAGAANTGRLPLDAGKFKLLMASGLDKDATKAYIEAGYMQSSFKTTALGVSPAGVTEFLSTTQNVIPEKDKYAAQIFQQAAAQSKVLADTGKLDKKNPAAVTEAFNNSVKATVAALQANIKYSDTGNPYQLPPPSVFAEDAVISKLPLYQKVIVAQKLDTSDPQRIFNAGIEAVKEGIISPKDLAVGLQQYYDKGTQVNNAGRNFTRYAIPEATHHVAAIRVPAGMAGTASDALTSWNPFSRYTDVKVDWTDPVQVTKTVATVLRGEAIMQIDSKSMFGVGADALQPAFTPRGFPSVK